MPITIGPIGLTNVGRFSNDDAPATSPPDFVPRAPRQPIPAGVAALYFIPLVGIAATAVEVDNPPFGSTQVVAQAAVYQWKAIPDPLPTLPPKLLAGLSVDNPPFGRTLLAAHAPAYQWKGVPDPLPQLNIKLLAGISVDNPPFGLADLEQRQPVSQWKAIPDPLPQLNQKLLSGLSVDNPPFGLSDLATQAPVYQWKAIPDPLPTLPPKLLAGLSVDNPVPYRRDWLSSVASAWIPPDPIPTLPVKLVPPTASTFVPRQQHVIITIASAPYFIPTVGVAATAVEVDNPPFGLSDLVNQSPVYQWKAIPDPLPTLGVKLVQGAPASVQPFRRDWLSTVASAWVPPDPVPTLPRILNASLTAVEVDNPPFGLSNLYSQAPVYQWKAIPDPLPTLNRKLLSGLSVDNPPFGLSDLATQAPVYQYWKPVPDPLPILPPKLLAGLSVDNPPPRRLQPQPAYQPEYQPLPQTSSLVAAISGPPPVVNNPPFGLELLRAQLSVLVTWFIPPVPQPELQTLTTQPTAGHPVPPGPGVFPAEFGPEVPVPALEPPNLPANTNFTPTLVPLSPPPIPPGPGVFPAMVPVAGVVPRPPPLQLPPNLNLLPPPPSS